MSSDQSQQSFEQIARRLLNVLRKPDSLSALQATLNPNQLVDLEESHQWLADFVDNVKATQAASVPIRQYLEDDFISILREHGLERGRVAELGGPFNSFLNKYDEMEVHHLSLYPSDGDHHIVVGDIGQADHIPDNTYDAIVSVSVLEHVAKPWNAARHMSRILKPGGIMYHYAPFSYFYHGAPADFWRYTPDAFEVLFPDLTTLRAEFNGSNRRRDNRGSAANRVDRDGGPEFGVDQFGGWRENWFSLYVGQKDLSAYESKMRHAQMAVALNLVKHRKGMGDSLKAALKAVGKISSQIHCAIDQEVRLVNTDEANFELTADEIATAWDKREFEGQPVQPSWNQFVIARAVGWIDD